MGNFGILSLTFFGYIILIPRRKVFETLCIITGSGSAISACKLPFPTNIEEGKCCLPHAEYYLDKYLIEVWFCK